jgi:AcrR family transcriptional regulator
VGGIGGTGRRSRRGVAPLSRQAIVDACVRIADAEGPDAVTLRRLGTELGVDATAIYRHFRDKDELLQVAGDWLIASALDGLDRTGDLETDLRALGLHVRQRYLRHPGLLVLVTMAPGPFKSEAMVTEAVLDILRGGGLSVEDAVLAFEVIEDYILSMTVLDASGAGDDSSAWRRAYADLPEDAFPRLAEAANRLYADRDARYRYGLDLLVASIAARRGAGPAGT